MMEPKQISQSWTVSEILQTYPKAKRVFLEKRTFCVGCYMARFCNLKDVAQVYNLEIDIVVHEIEQTALHTTDPSQERKA